MYQYRCNSCSQVVEQLRRVDERSAPATCECGGVATKMVSPVTMKVWQPITLEHIADEPMTFTKEGDLRKYCNDNNLESGALL